MKLTTYSTDSEHTQVTRCSHYTEFAATMYIINTCIHCNILQNIHNKSHNYIYITRRALGGAHVPPTRVFRRLTE